MIKVDDWLKGLKHLCQKRRTVYSNIAPYNCGYIWPSGIISFDCIGLVKSTINEPDICYKTKPSGYFVQPGQVIPDTTELGILQLCSDVVWGDFRKLTPGEYLYMEGHAGIYVGDLFGKGAKVNVIECTGDWSGGVLATWIDLETGQRKDWEPGSGNRYWEAHGKLSHYVSYNKKKSITAIAREVIAGKWGTYPERKKKLEAAGYDYAKVQKKVDELLKE